MASELLGDGGRALMLSAAHDHLGASDPVGWGSEAQERAKRYVAGLLDRVERKNGRQFCSSLSTLETG
jgi:hypothetical protein